MAASINTVATKFINVVTEWKKMNGKLCSYRLRYFFVCFILFFLLAPSLQYHLVVISLPATVHQFKSQKYNIWWFKMNRSKDLERLFFSAKWTCLNTFFYSLIFFRSVVSFSVLSYLNSETFRHFVRVRCSILTENVANVKMNMKWKQEHEHFG